MSYCADFVRTHDYDRFLLALFVPQNNREAILAVYALNAELANIRRMVSEELIGHMRYAWWEDAIMNPPPGQPVLGALQSKNIQAETLLPLVQIYRSHYPEMPDVDTVLENITLSLCPEAEKNWDKAKRIIANHRTKYGQKRNNWLRFKLLIS